MAAVWPGKETDPPEPRRMQEWKITIRTRMPKPCNERLFSSATDGDGAEAGRRASKLLDGLVRRHIDGCKKCQANGVKRP